jgi:hypothetical protein
MNAKCNSCQSFNVDCSGMSNHFTGCIYYKEEKEMSAYQTFVKTPGIIKPGKIARLWELEVSGAIENLIDFCREFLEHKGFMYTGYESNGKAIFNNDFIWDGAIQDGNKIALRIVQI